jgi:hypothetical protein
MDNGYGGDALMEVVESDAKTFIVVLSDRQRKVEGIYSYWIDSDLKILYLRDGNGEIIAVFNEWLYFAKFEKKDKS